MRRRGILVVIVLAAACSGEPGGGGVNISEPTLDSAPVTTSMATTTTQPTTTTTAPATTTSVPIFSLVGRVVRGDGEPVARAFVIMGESVEITGPDGWFAFSTTSPGAMAVSKPGWIGAALEWDEATSFYEATITPAAIRGLRVSAEAAADDSHFEHLLNLADETAVNALVFDTKRERGQVLYDTKVSAAHDMGAVDVFYDARQRVTEAHEHGLYTITRIVTFEDEQRARAFPEERLIGPWLDPASETARSYLLDLAAEACDIGFDEIQFDYVRYPSGQTAEMSGQRDLTQEQRLTAVADFLADARETLRPRGCALSAAVFGIVVSSPDDQGIGQRPEEISAQVDTFSPMVYPSHYSEGWLGFNDPNEYPYEVTADAITDATPRLHEGTQLRPYLQAFWWSNAQIRRSIQAAEDAGTGWLLWNVLSNFDIEALPTDAEVEDTQP